MTLRHRSLRSLCLLPLLVPLLGATLVTDGVATNERARFALEVPVGWVLDKRGHAITVSRDGFAIHAIGANRRDLDEAFPAQKMAAREDMDLEELGALYIAEAKRGNENLEVITTEPATLSGRDAVRAEWRFATTTGLRFRVSAYVMVTPDGLYEVWYKAPELHYFERDAQAFAAAIASFRYEPKVRQRRG